MKPTFKLILMVFFCAAAMVGYALFPEEPVIHIDFSFRQFPVRELLNDFVENAPSDNIAGKSAASQSDISFTTALDTLVIPSVTQVDTSSQRILLIGDSMTGLICWRLSKYAAHNSHVMECVSIPSTTTFYWASNGRMQKYVNSFKPTYVFVCIGSNELSTRDLTGVSRNVRKIREALGALPVIWIGPPNWCEDNGFNKTVEEEMGEGAYYPSYKLEFERGSDGRHPTRGAADKWIDALAQWMRDGNSIHPIMMEMPPANMKKADFKMIYIAPENRNRAAKDSLAADGPAAAFAEDGVFEQAQPQDEQAQSLVSFQQQSRPSDIEEADTLAK